METAEAERDGLEPALADPRENPRDLFGRGLRLVVSYVRMHPRPFAIAVAGAFLFAVGSVAVTVAYRCQPVDPVDPEAGSRPEVTGVASGQPQEERLRLLIRLKRRLIRRTSIQGSP